MKTHWQLLGLAVLATALVCGCQSSDNADPAPGDADNTEATDDTAALQEGETQLVSLCGTCGEVKGTTNCCDENCAECDKCGLHEGAPMCCKVPADSTGEDVQFCGKCGEAAGTDKCCKEAEACEECGRHKGSPICCQEV